MDCGDGCIMLSIQKATELYSLNGWVCNICAFSLNTAVHINKKEKLKVLASHRVSLFSHILFPSAAWSGEKYSFDGYVSPPHYFWISNILSALNTAFSRTRLWVHRSQRCLRNVFIQNRVLHSLACIFHIFMLSYGFCVVPRESWPLCAAAVDSGLEGGVAPCPFPGSPHHLCSLEDE